VNGRAGPQAGSVGAAPDYTPRSGAYYPVARRIPCWRCRDWDPYRPVVVYRARNGALIAVRAVCHDRTYPPIELDARMLAWIDEHEAAA
jgi:hypothetical protein